MSPKQCLCPLVVISVLCTSPVAFADWTRFRGPNGSGVSADDATMPLRWSASANLKWKAELPGPGVSCPIAVGDRIYVTSYSGYGLDREHPGDQTDLKRHLVCLARDTGRQIWKKTVDPVLPEDPYAGVGVPAHGYASHTPVSDGENVFVFFGKTGALAFDRNGKQLWQTSVGNESDPRRWGSASSPILYNNLLIVPATAESQALVALDKTTGKEVWRQEAAGFSSSWSTPILVKVNENRTDLVIGVPKEIWGLNPDTGKLRWYCEGIKSNSFCSSVAVHDGVIYAMGARGGKSLAVRVGGNGNVTESHVVWTGRDSSEFGSPIVHNGRIYAVAEGIATVIDATTGERIFRTRLKGGGEAGGGRLPRDYASPILADDKLYYVNRSGDMFVLKANDKLEQIAVNRLTGEDANEGFNATPAAGNGGLFIRSDKHMYCVALMDQKVSDQADPNRNTSAPANDVVPEDNQQGSRRGGGRRFRGGGRNGFDPAEFFRRRDSNSDGKLSGDEISERMRGRMDQIDSDKDGAITPEEFRKGIGRMFGGGGRRGQGANRGEDKPERPQRPQLED